MWTSTQFEKRRSDVTKLNDIRDEILSLENTIRDAKAALKKAKAERSALAEITDEEDRIFVQAEKFTMDARSILLKEFSLSTLSELKSGETLTYVLRFSEHAFPHTNRIYSKYASNAGEIDKVCGSISDFGMANTAVTYTLVKMNKRCSSCKSTEDNHTHVNGIIVSDCGFCDNRKRTNVDDGFCSIHVKCDECKIDAPCSNHSTEHASVHNYTVVYTMP